MILELWKVASANIGNYIRVNGDGLAEVDFSGCTKEQLAALESIETKEYADGRGENARDIITTKFKMASKMSALSELCKMLQLTNNVDVTSGGEPIGDSKPVDLGSMVSQLLREEPDLVDAMREKAAGSESSGETD